MMGLTHPSLFLLSRDRVQLYKRLWKKKLVKIRKWFCCRTILQTRSPKGFSKLSFLWRSVWTCKPFVTPQHNATKNVTFTQMWPNASGKQPKGWGLLLAHGFRGSQSIVVGQAWQPRKPCLWQWELLAFTSRRIRVEKTLPGPAILPNYVIRCALGVQTYGPRMDIWDPNYKGEFCLLVN